MSAISKLTMALALVMVPVSAVITTQAARAAATFTTLYNFCSQSGCTDGKGGGTQLIQATDGNLYGTSFLGGAGGTLKSNRKFQVTP